MPVPQNNPLQYLGVRAPNPPTVIEANRAPTTSDINYPIGTQWIFLGSTSYVLVGISAGSANWANSSTADPFIVSKSESGGDVLIEVKNTSNTASSSATLEAEVAGTSAGDPNVKFTISGGTSWIAGADNSASDAFVIASGTALGTNNALSIAASGLASTFSGDITTTRAAAGAAVTLTVENSEAGATANSSVIQQTVAAASTGDLQHTMTIASGQSWSLGVDNSASDAFVISSGTALGTNNALSVAVSGLGASFGGDVSVTRAAAGAAVTLTVENSEAGATANTSVIQQTVAAASTGDLQHTMTIASGQSWSWGVDNSASDAFVLSSGTALGTNNALSVATSTLASTFGGDVSTPGNLTLSATGKGIRIKGGVATDMVGTAVLSSGTVTVSNTNIATGDLIFLSRVAAGASTTLGILSYTISNGASFTITSLILGTPGSTQTGDVSSVAYMIVRPV